MKIDQFTKDTFSLTQLIESCTRYEEVNGEKPSLVFNEEFIDFILSEKSLVEAYSAMTLKEVNKLKPLELIDLLKAKGLQPSLRTTLFCKELERTNV
jgi:hypothetical protein